MTIGERTLKKWRREVLTNFNLKTDPKAYSDYMPRNLALSNERILKMTQELFAIIEREEEEGEKD